MNNPLTNVKTVNASSSDPKCQYENLNSGASGFWRSDSSKPFPAWLNFDLGNNFLLHKVRVISTIREMAPKQFCVDYFGNDFKLIGRDIAKHTFNATSPSYKKFQEFEIVENEHAVKFVRVRILNSWGADSVQLNTILFFGKASQKGVVSVPRAGPSDVPLTYVPQTWYIGSRVRYRWEVGQKWYEGRILHINTTPNGSTYLIKDDSGWVKDGITPQNTRNPQYPRKPRKLRASCPEISLKPILESLREELNDGKDSEEGSSFCGSSEPEDSEEDIEGEDLDVQDAAEKDDKSEVLIQKNISPENHVNGISESSRNRHIIHGNGSSLDHPDAKTSDLYEQMLEEDVKAEPSDFTHVNPLPELNISSAISDKSGSDDNRTLHELVKQTSKQTSKQTTVSSVQRVKGSENREIKNSSKPSIELLLANGDISRNARESQIIANNFKMKKLNGAYSILPEQRAGRPMFINPKGLVLWYSEVGTWMISQEHLIGTDKSNAFVWDAATNPLNIRNSWSTFNKTTKSWDSDSGYISSLHPHKGDNQDEDDDDDHLSLAEIKAKNDRQRLSINKVGNDVVSWKVVLCGFKVQKLNSEYICRKEESNGHARYYSPSGLVLWWYNRNRRKLWMVSPEKLVGTDKSYACVEDECLHPSSISGVWQVFDKSRRKFEPDEGGRIRPGRAEKVSLKGFMSQPDMNGVYVETKNRIGHRPTFKKLGKRNLVLFYRNSTDKWYVRREGMSMTDATPIVACDISAVNRATSKKAEFK